MSEEPDSPIDEPGPVEALFYLGTGAFFAFVLVFGVGLSIYGHHRTSEAREARVAAAASVADADDVDRGGEIYALRCASCHGAEGEGGVGPGLAGVVGLYPNVDDHAAVVREGRAAMPAFEGVLTEAQIEQVVRFERERLGG